MSEHTQLTDLGPLTPAELLEQVDRAISTVLAGGQSYKIGSRSLTRADLSIDRQNVIIQAQAVELAQLGALQREEEIAALRRDYAETVGEVST